METSANVVLPDISIDSDTLTDPLTSNVLVGFRVPIPNC